MVAEAGAEEAYVQGMAAAQETRQVALAQAHRDLTATGDQTAYETAVQNARQEYNTSNATHAGDYRTAVATARRDYRQAVHGTGGTDEVRQAAWDQALYNFRVLEANGYADMLIDIANLDKGWRTLVRSTAFRRNGSGKPFGRAFRLKAVLRTGCPSGP